MCPPKKNCKFIIAQIRTDAIKKERLDETVKTPDIGRSSKNRTYARGVRGLCAAITPYSNIYSIVYTNFSRKSRIFEKVSQEQHKGFRFVTLSVSPSR